MNLHRIKQAPNQGTFKSWFWQICINWFEIPRISMAWAETVACKNSAWNVSIVKLKEIINDIIILNWMWLFNSYSMLYPPKFLAISFLLSGMFPSAGVNIAETWVRNDKWFFCWNILQTALPARCVQSFSFDKQFLIIIVMITIINDNDNRKACVLWCSISTCPVLTIICWQKGNKSIEWLSDNSVESEKETKLKLI